MKPNVKREQRNGWLVLGAVGIICGGVVGWYASSDDLEAKLRSATSAHQSKLGKELMVNHIKQQKVANEILSQSIDDLKKGTNFTVSPFFKFSDAELSTKVHLTDLWLRDKFSVVVDEINGRARDYSFKEWDEYANIGFSQDPTKSDDEVAYNSIMLQLTYRAAVICFSLPPAGGPEGSTDHIHSLKITHDTKPHLVGPAGRPALLREYNLKVQVKAPLTEVMWILYRFSDIKPSDDLAMRQPDLPYDPGTYPLVLQNLTILGDPKMATEPTKPFDQTLDVDATFDIAAMEFIEDAKRGSAPASPPAPTAGPAHAPVAPAAGGPLQMRP